MTLEELKKELATGVGKELITSMIDDAVSGLKTKNDELLGKLTNAKETNNSITTRLEKIEAERDAQSDKDLEKSGDIEKLRTELEARHAKALEAETDKTTAMQKQLNTHVLGQGLTDALVKAKVAPQLMDAAKALIQSQYEGSIGDNDGKPFAKVDGKAVNDFVTEWSQSDSGKHFISADNNSGGGTQNTNGSGKAADNISSVDRIKNGLKDLK